jgi:hypothetical protein
MCATAPPSSASLQHSHAGRGDGRHAGKRCEAVGSSKKQATKVRATPSPPEVHRRAALFHIIAHASCLRGTNIRHETNVMCSTAAALSRVAGKSSRWTSRLFRCVNCAVWLCEHGSSATRGAARLIAVNTTLTLWNAITVPLDLPHAVTAPRQAPRPAEPDYSNAALEKELSLRFAELRGPGGGSSEWSVEPQSRITTFSRPLHPCIVRGRRAFAFLLFLLTTSLQFAQPQVDCGGHAAVNPRQARAHRAARRS